MQRKEILRLFGYRPWSQKFMPVLSERAAQQVRRDVTPAFILTELIALLRQKRIIRPGYNMQARWGREALRGAIVHITPCSNTYSGAVATFYQVCGQHFEGYQQPGGIAPRLVLALGSSRLGH